MAKTDIRVKELQIIFTDEQFRTPLKLSTGEISEITYVKVTATVENRLGATAEGIGGILLSDLWAFPSPTIAHREKDRIMREIVLKIEELLHFADDYYDPLQLANLVETMLARVLRETRRELAITEEIPKLVGVVCWSPFDAALHDGWGKAAGRCVYQMYTGEYLNYDLEYYLGSGWKGLYPDQFLALPKRQLWVQHAVGASDPLTHLQAQVEHLPDDGIPVSLEEWIQKEQVRWFKLKVKGSDVAWDLQRIIDVYRVAVESAEANGIKQRVLYEIDPNEGCSEPEPMIELLRKLREIDLAAYEALVYIEQPTPRNLGDYHFNLKEISKYKPVLVDESLEDLDNLQHIERLGWSGVALKTCKGQSHAIETYCWAREKNLFITVQDLTNPGYSLIHSANLCSHLALSFNGFEYNSRQYAPFSRIEERKPYSELFTVRGGKIDLSQIRGRGLY